MPNLRTIIILMTGFLIALIIVACIALIINLIIIIPKPPTLVYGTSASEQETKAKEITNYKELYTTIQNQRTGIFDYVVIKTLLPLFSYLIATVLTFIFGKVVNKLISNFFTVRKKYISNDH